MVDGGSTVSLTAYMGAFVAQNGSLSYVTTTEGRMRISGSTAVYEYFIRDHLGAVRASFEKGSGSTAVLRQENSYYGYGLVHSATITPTDANKELYNSGSLWENDFANDPDLYSTGIRQYDPLLGRFNGTDPVAVKYALLSPYQYAFNNPISFSDPTGADPDYSEWWDMFWQDIYYNPAYQHGGYWNDPWKGTNSFTGFSDPWAAFDYYSAMLDQHEGWKQTAAASYDRAFDSFYGAMGGMDAYGSIMLRTVTISEMDSNPNWLSSRIDEVWGAGGTSSNNWALFLGAVGGGTQVVETHFQAMEASTRKDGSVNWAWYSAHTLWLDKINNFGGDMGSAGTPTLNRRVATKASTQFTKSNLKLGQEMHKAYHAGKVGKEFRLPSGKRIDFLDIENGIIYELKPFNPRAMQQGQKQLNMYLKQLQSPAMLQKYPEFRGINWKTVLDTY